MTLLVPMLFILGASLTSHSALRPARAQSLYIVKIGVGPSGAEANGTFILTEERTTFSRTADREVIVSFEWDGVPGTHKLAAQWRSPEGGTTSSSAFDYVARARRFGAYWRLGISPVMSLGTWSIEATVDGQPAGRITFEITDATSAPGVKRRLPLSQDEVYARLSRAFVPIVRIAPSGRELNQAAAYRSNNGWLHTLLGTVDAVDKLHAIRPDGSTAEIVSLLAWNRPQGWAVLQGDAGTHEPLPVAAADTIKVGDRCFSMQAGGAGARALVEGTITGHETPGSATRRPLATFLTGPPTRGAPVVNEFGDIIGIVTGSVPEVSRLVDLQLPGIAILPMSVFSWKQDAAPQPIADLRASGRLLAPVAGDEHVLSGGFARGIARGLTVAPEAQADQFSMTEKEFVVFVTWSPRQRLRGMALLRVYDAQNQVIAESKPKKSDFRKGDLKLSSWTLPMFARPGTYRADVLLDDKPMWRGYVQIHP